MSAKARILVVDDERSMQEFLEIFFRREGYHVVTAGDLDTARTHLEEDEFDVVITDIQMPGGSGLDLLRTAHEISPESIVIMITAFASTETAIGAMKEGAYDYITKPFKVDEIKLVVEKALEKKLLSSREPAPAQRAAAPRARSHDHRKRPGDAARLRADRAGGRQQGERPAARAEPARRWSRARSTRGASVTSGRSWS